MKRFVKQLGLILCILLMCSAAACSRSATTAGPNNNKKSMTDEELINYNKEKIDENKIMDTIKELTSEKYQGRLIGTQGNIMTEDYIASNFKQIGLTNPKGLENYKQSFNYDAATLSSEPTLKIVDKSNKAVKEYKNGFGFTIRFLSSKSNSYGVKAPAYILKDAQDMVSGSVRGKAVLVSSDVSKSINLGQCLAQGYAAGAEFVIIETKTYGEGEYKLLPNRAIGAVGNINGGNSIPIIYVDNNSFKELTEAANNNFDIEFKYNASLEKQKEVGNVVGLIEGTDEKLKKKCIIVGAHFDHLGSNCNGTYNSGALDNASGTAALIELARVIKANKIQTKKSILFIAFNGEEIGSLGAEFYVDNPVFPLGDSVMVNLDMVGSAAVAKLSISNSNELSSELLKDAGKVKLEAAIENPGGSDHLVFTDSNVTATMLSNNDVKNGYHTSKDTIDKVSKDNIEKIVNTLLYYIEKN